MFSCDEENNIQSNEITHFSELESRSTENNNISDHLYAYNGNYLEFNSFQDLDELVRELNLEEHNTLNAWEEKQGFISQRRIFHNVMIEEEKIEQEILSLPEEEQDAIFSGEEYNSQTLLDALENDLIRYYTVKKDGSQYWDYTIVDPGVASVVNLEGVVKVANQLIKYSTSDLIYVSKNGTEENLNYALQFDDNYEDDKVLVLRIPPYDPEKIGPEGPVPPAPPALCFSTTHTVNFSKFNSWREPSNRRRVKLWVDGRATANFGAGCRRGTTCTFQLRSQAQVKNLWGNWRYRSSYSPTLNVDDANRNFEIVLQDRCNDTNQEIISNLPSNGTLEPIWDGFWPRTNNGFFKMHPHTSGWWVFDDKKICRTIDISYNIPANYSIYSNWNLVN